MGSEDELLNENIGEYVSDDNKIVTCKWLSLTHSININAAKRALHTFVEHQRKEGQDNGINVTYFVAGLGKSKDGVLTHKCAVVPESELEEVKGSLSALTSCHIFSVQKAKLKDYTPLYMTDYEIIKNNLEKCNSFSSIKCPWVSLKSANPPPRIIQQDVVKPENKENAPSKKQDSNKDSGGPTAKASTKKAEPKGSIASMFASATKKGDGGNQTAKPVQKTEAASKAKAPEKKGGVMAFFEKGGDSSSNKKTSVSSKKTESKVTQKEKEEPKRKKKQTADSDDEAPDKKRRKRIRTDLFDSSDEEDAQASGNEDRNEDEEEAEDNKMPDKEEEKEETKVKEEKNVEEKNEFVTISSNDSAASGKKRKRTKKVVTKHYQDNEGFMVTKKETVWESETDDEDEPTAKQEPAPKKTATETMGKPAAKGTTAKAEPKGKAAAKKNVSPQKSKQTSLMSFFKKK